MKSSLLSLPDKTRSPQDNGTFKHAHLLVVRVWKNFPYRHWKVVIWKLLSKCDESRPCKGEAIISLVYIHTT